MITYQPTVGVFPLIIGLLILYFAPYAADTQLRMLGLRGGGRLAVRITLAMRVVGGLIALVGLVSLCIAATRLL